MIEYSVVIPVYNEEENVRPLVERVSKVMKGLGEPFEIVLVDDGSKDQTGDRLRALVG